MRVNLTGLTKEQCVMLDLLWELDSKEKYLRFMETLSPKSLQMAIVLQEMVIQEISEKNGDFDPDLGNKMLTSIGVKL